MNEQIRAGVVGLGAMGAPMARHLAQANLLGMVWNRTNSRAESLAEEIGVLVGDEPEQVASACNVILTCVSADQDLLEVLEQMLPGIKPDIVVVDTSTVSPQLPGWLLLGSRTSGPDL
jgi:3-hydroxyisobutyrate dehydrogenase